MQPMHYQIADRALRSVLRRLPYSRKSEFVALWWGYRYQPKLGLVRLRSGALLERTANDHLQLLLYYLGCFEPKAVDEMLAHARPGSLVLDVGANVGVFTIEAAKAGASVVAIEAAPKHAEAIKRSATANGFSGIEVHPCAAGEAEGEAILSLPDGGNQGMFTLGAATKQGITVSVRSIDMIVAGRTIDFIKMDIEGSEFSALKGARKTIEKSKPPILIELNEAALKGCGSSAREVKELLFRWGYRGSIISTGRDVGIDDTHDCDECLFLHG